MLGCLRHGTADKSNRTPSLPSIHKFFPPTSFQLVIISSFFPHSHASLVPLATYCAYFSVTFISPQPEHSSPFVNPPSLHFSLYLSFFSISFQLSFAQIFCSIFCRLFQSLGENKTLHRGLACPHNSHLFPLFMSHCILLLVLYCFPPRPKQFSSTFHICPHPFPHCIFQAMVDV